MRISINTANTQSQVISVLRFPLVVLILFIHSNFHDISANWDVFWTINTTGIGPQLPSLGDVFDIISNSLATLANPFFFFISGSLFFKEGLFSKELYLHKLQRRAFSLLLPYILWISTYLFLLSVAEGIFPNWTAIVHKPIESFSFTDWLLCFWDISKIGPQGGIAAPLVIPFWYIRDLMIICLFTPIIYKVLHWLANKQKEISILLFVALLYASRWAENLPGLSVQGLLFFSFGAFFSIKQIKFIDVMRPLKWGGLFFAIFAWQINCANLMYAGLIVFTVSTTTRILERRKQQNKLAFPLPLVLINSTFFVFAFHSIVLGGILTILKHGIVVPHNELEAFLIYILSPVTMLTVSVGVYWLFYKIAPRIVSIYCGGR